MSTVWFWVIVVAGAVLAFATMQYPLAKDRERVEVVTQRVIALVRPELERNMSVLQEKKKALERSEKDLTVVTFDTTAWESAANTMLIGGIPSEQLSQLLQAYHLMKRANETQEHIMDMILGIGSVVKGKPHEENKSRLFQVLQSTIVELESIIDSLLREWNSG